MMTRLDLEDLLRGCARTLGVDYERFTFTEDYGAVCIHVQGGLSPADLEWVLDIAQASAPPWLAFDIGRVA